VVGRRHGVDPRSTGSGNIGATNVARSMGRRAGVVTLAGDVAKGAFPQLVCQSLGLDVSVAAYAGMASVLGHLYPVFSGFRGGKGVATAFGVLLVVAPAAAVGALAVFVVSANATRYVSVGSMAAAAVLPFALFVFDSPWDVVQMGMLIAAALLWRHRENLVRLMQHSEPTF
jgi:glycerol-3-phosphate acyltransferase PlsY